MPFYAGITGYGSLFRARMQVGREMLTRSFFYNTIPGGFCGRRDDA